MVGLFAFLKTKRALWGLLSVASVAVLLTSFQNCGKGFSSGSAGGGQSSLASTTNDDGTVYTQDLSLNSLEGSQTKVSLICSDSDPVRNQIIQFYLNYFKRCADQEGLDYYRAVIVQGGSLSDIDNLIKNSPEYAATQGKSDAQLVEFHSPNLCIDSQYLYELRTDSCRAKNASSCVATDISVSDGFSCAVVNGAAKCWGDNSYGQLGNNSSVGSNIPVQVQGLESGVTQISTSYFSACAIVNGSAKCWGENGFGQLGNNSSVGSNSNIPVQVQGLESGVTQISAGFSHTCAIVNGSAKCWGYGEPGKLGNNSTERSSIPVQVQGLESGVTQISAGDSHTCAIVNGSAKCWGANDYGQLGNNSRVKSLIPVQVQGLESGVTAINAGHRSTCAILRGDLMCLGWLSNIATPVSGWGPFTQIEAISELDKFFCVFDNGGAVKCQQAYWSGNPVKNYTTINANAEAYLRSGVTAISTHSGDFMDAHICAIKAGTVKCWGDNSFGQLGSNSTIKSNDPVEVVGLCHLEASSPVSCRFGGEGIAHGSSVSAYQSASVAFGSTCVSQSRVCNNGTLSGSYTNASCSVGAAPPPPTPVNCTFNNQTIAHGSSVPAYQSASVAFGSTCVSQSRVCSNGTLSGSYTNASCSVGAAASCTFNNQTIAHGSSVPAYQSASVAFGSTCVSQSRVCSNGTLSGSYTNASCSVGAAASCTFNNQTIAHGSSVPAYQSASVPFGSTCTSQSRVCSNGTLSGSYTNASCFVGAALSCSFNSQTVDHNSSVIAYQSASVAFGSTCTSQSRVCANGTLSGAYTNASCTVGPAPVVSSRDQIIALYKRVLDRTDAELAEDEAGIVYWVDKLNTSMTITQIEQSFRASDEYFVRQQYKNELHRNGDTGGIRYYVNLIAAFVKTRAQVTSEFRNVCLNHINNECL